MINKIPNHLHQYIVEQNYDNYTKAHLSNSAEMIETILNAEKQIN